MPSKSTSLAINTSDDSAAPSIDFLNSTVFEAPKSSIGVRKIQPKKSGLGAKKGLGATKLKTNFADIENRANQADQVKEIVVCTENHVGPLTYMFKQFRLVLDC